MGFISIFKEKTKEQICILTKTNLNNKHYPKSKTSLKKKISWHTQITNFARYGITQEKRVQTQLGYLGSGVVSPLQRGLEYFLDFKLFGFLKHAFWEWYIWLLFRQGRIMIDKWKRLLFVILPKYLVNLTPTINGYARKQSSIIPTNNERSHFRATSRPNCCPWINITRMDIEPTARQKKYATYVHQWGNVQRVQGSSSTISIKKMKNKIDYKYLTPTYSCFYLLFFRIIKLHSFFSLTILHIHIYIIYKYIYIIYTYIYIIYTYTFIYM